MQSVYNCQGTNKKLRIIHEFELYNFELDKFDCILCWAPDDERIDSFETCRGKAVE